MEKKKKPMKLLQTINEKEQKKKAIKSLLVQRHKKEIWIKTFAKEKNRLLNDNKGRKQPTKISRKTCKKKQKKRLNIDMRRKARKRNWKKRKTMLMKMLKKLAKHMLEESGAKKTKMK